MINKLIYQKRNITNIKNGIDIKESKANLMMLYVDTEQPLPIIYMLSETIDKNINLFETIVAFTWFKLNYNYLREIPLDRYDSDLFQKLFFDVVGKENKEILDDETIALDDESYFNIFNLWYEITKNEIEHNGTKDKNLPG